MAEPFTSEIRMWGFSWSPRDWAFCDGATLPIAQHQALYSLLGVRFGGDGRSTFNLPDLRGRSPVGTGDNQSIHFQIGHQGGAESVSLSSAQMGQHTHSVRGTTAQGDTKQFTNAIFASGHDVRTDQATQMYGNPNSLTGLNSNSVSTNGGGTDHTNIQPSLVLNFCIAMTGVFPPRS